MGRRSEEYFGQCVRNQQRPEGPKELAQPARAGKRSEGGRTKLRRGVIYGAVEPTPVTYSAVKP